MDIGIGLPNAVPGATGGQMVEWAKRADARGCSSRFTLGIGLGAREDDAEASGVELRGRGRRLLRSLARFADGWIASGTGPAAGL